VRIISTRKCARFSHTCAHSTNIPKDFRLSRNLPCYSYPKAYTVLAESGYSNRVTAFGNAGALVPIPLRTRFLTLLHKGQDRLWGPSSLLFNGYRGCCLWVKRPGRELAAHLPIVPRLRMSEAKPLLSLYTASWRKQSKRYLYLYTNSYSSYRRSSSSSSSSSSH